MIVTAITLIIAYLIGSISSAIVVCRLMHLPDPRTEGSKNPGATNVLRLGGKKAAIITLLGDALKGTLPVLLGQALGLDMTILCFIAFSAFIGHLFPVFFNFEGGKGVATFIGSLLALAWPIGLLWLLAWGLTAACFRYSSLAALVASALTPVFFSLRYHNPTATMIIASMSVILIIRHQENIIKLCRGTERKIGKKSSSR